MLDPVLSEIMSERKIELKAGDVMRIKFRPSSHSADLTIVATYKNTEEAKKIEKTLIRLIDEAQNDSSNDFILEFDPTETYVGRTRNRVYLYTNTDDDLPKTQSFIRENSNPQNIEAIADYQELTIYVKMAKNLVTQNQIGPALALVLDGSEVKLLEWLTKNCGKPQTTRDNDKTQTLLKWSYRGESIYMEDENSLLDINLDKKDKWEIQVDY
jgi:hypothetical protein